MSDSRLEQKIDTIIDDIHDLDINVAVLNGALLEHTKRDDATMVGINKSLEEVDTRLDEYNNLLSIHIQGVVEAKRQNDLLQQEVNLFKQYMDSNFKSLNEKVAELEKPAVVIKGILWVIASLTAILGLVFLLKDLL